jgi:hypothetical protein
MEWATFTLTVPDTFHSTQELNTNPQILLQELADVQIMQIISNTINPHYKMEK